MTEDMIAGVEDQVLPLTGTSKEGYKQFVPCEHRSRYSIYLRFTSNGGIF